MEGLIVRSIAGFYDVEAGGRIYACRARGKFRRDGVTPLVGDKVRFRAQADGGMLEEILQRKNSIIRPPLANVDRLFIVSAYECPRPNTLLIDQLIAIARANSIKPIPVFNKSDAGDMSAWIKIYSRAGLRPMLVSCKTGDGLDALFAAMQTGLSALTGNSGVGKSSLLNRLLPTLGLETGEVSEKLGRGRHTTRQVSLHKIGAGYVADTPGFSSLDWRRAGTVDRKALPLLFEEFAPYLGRCRYTSCSHTGEEGCAIAAAVAQGTVEASRYQSYLALYEQIKDWKVWDQSKQDV